MKPYYVYKVTNKTNGKSYIGRTVDFLRRITQHTKPSVANENELHRDFINYGVNNFTWEILEIVDGRVEADIKEREYIEKFHTVEPHGYNKTLGGTGGIASSIKAILCFEEDGTLIKKYKSASEARNDGFPLHGVIDCCESKATQCLGKIFMYEDDYKKKGFLKKEKDYTPLYHPVVQCDLNGNYIAEYESVKQAAEQTGLIRASISSNITGARKTTGGKYIFVYKEDFPIRDINKHSKKLKGKKVARLDPKTNQILEVYNSIAEAGRELGVNYKAIQRIVDRDNRTAYGFKWISQ